MSGYYAQKLRWRPCGHGFQRARLLVPFGYQRPAWRRFSLPVIRLAATGPGTSIGSLVVNPGGPEGLASGTRCRPAAGFRPPCGPGSMWSALTHAGWALDPGGSLPVRCGA